MSTTQLHQTFRDWVGQASAALCERLQRMAWLAQEAEAVFEGKGSATCTFRLTRLIDNVNRVLALGDVPPASEINFDDTFFKVTIVWRLPTQQVVYLQSRKGRRNDPPHTVKIVWQERVECEDHYSTRTLFEHVFDLVTADDVAHAHAALLEQLRLANVMEADV
jgi:hypothetical protein